MPQTTTFRPRAALWAVLSTLAISVLWADTRPEVFTNRGLNLFRLPPDFMVYYTAGERLNSGADIYNGGLWGHLPFTYPPFAGIVFRLLPLFPPIDSAILWTMLCVGALVSVTVGVLVQRGWRLDVGTVALGVLAAGGSMALAPVRESFFYGQINLVLMALVSLDFLRRRDRFTGIGVGLAAGLKLTPTFFILVMLMQRRFRDAATATITFAITVLVGLIMVPDSTKFWTSAVIDSERIGILTNPGAQSLKSTAIRWLGQEGTASTVLWLIMVVVVVAACAAAVMEAHRRGNNALIMALGGITACLISPFSWHHHWVWLLPLALCLIDLGMQIGRTIAHRSQFTTAQAHWATQMGALTGSLCAAAIMLPYLSTSYAFELSFWAMQSHGPMAATWYTWQGAAIVVSAGVFSLWLRRRPRSHHMAAQEILTAKEASAR